MSDWYNLSNEIEGIWPQEENTVLFNKWPRSLLDNWYEEHPTLPTALSTRHPSNTACVIDNQTILLPKGNAVNSNSSSNIEPVLTSSDNIPFQNFFYQSNVPSFSTERISNPVENNSVISYQPNFVDIRIGRVAKNPTGNVGQIDCPISILNPNVPSFTSTVSTGINNSYLMSDTPQYSSDPTIDESSKNSLSRQTISSLNNELKTESYNIKMPLNSTNQYKVMRHLPNSHSSNGEKVFNPNSPMCQSQPLDSKVSLSKMYKAMRNIVMTNESFQTNTYLQPSSSASLGSQEFSPREESLNEMKKYSLAVRKNPQNVTIHSDSEDIQIDSIKHFPALPKKLTHLTSNTGLNDSNMNKNCLNIVECCGYTDYEPQSTNEGSHASFSYKNTENTLNALEISNLISLYKQNSINESNQYSPQLLTSQIVCSSDAILVHSGPEYTMAPNSVQLQHSTDDIYRNASNNILYNTLKSRRIKNLRKNIPPQVVGNIINIDNGNQLVLEGTRILKPYIYETERKLFMCRPGVQRAATLGVKNATTSGIQNTARLVAQSTSILDIQNSTPLEFQNAAALRLQHNLARSSHYDISTAANKNDRYTTLTKELDFNRRLFLNKIITGAIPNPNSESTEYPRN